MKLLQKRATTYRNSASVKAVAAVLNVANRLGDNATCQKKENTLFDTKGEMNDARNCDKALNDRLVSPSDISDRDMNLLEGNEESECIFPLSLGAYGDASNAQPVSISPPHDPDMLSGDLRGRITPDSSNTSRKIAGNDCDHWPTRFEPCKQTRNHKKEKGLWTIPEDSWEQ